MFYIMHSQLAAKGHMIILIQVHARKKPRMVDYNNDVVVVVVNARCNYRE